MAHYPVNHPLRQLYRLVAALIGLYYTAFGVIGLARTAGDPFFDRGDVGVLGLRTNFAMSLLALLGGLAVIVAAAIGRNIHHWVSMVGGWALVALGVVTMAFLQTDANILNVAMANVVTYLVTGLLLITSGLYGRVGKAHTEAVVRHEPVAKV